MYKLKIIQHWLQRKFIKDKDVSFNMVDSNGLTVNSFVVNNILAPIHIDQEASGNQLTLIFNEIVEDLSSTSVFSMVTDNVSNQITNVSSNGSNIVLTGANTFVEMDSLLIYTKDASNAHFNIRDSDNKATESFTKNIYFRPPRVNSLARVEMKKIKMAMDKEMVNQFDLSSVSLTTNNVNNIITAIEVSGNNVFFTVTDDIVGVGLNKFSYTKADNKDKDFIDIHKNYAVFEHSNL